MKWAECVRRSNNCYWIRSSQRTKVDYIKTHRFEFGNFLAFEFYRLPVNFIIIVAILKKIKNKNNNIYERAHFAGQLKWPVNIRFIIRDWLLYDDKRENETRQNTKILTMNVFLKTEKFARGNKNDIFIGTAAQDFWKSIARIIVRRVCHDRNYKYAVHTTEYDNSTLHNLTVFIHKYNFFFLFFSGNRIIYYTNHIYIFFKNSGEFTARS